MARTQADLTPLSRPWGPPNLPLRLAYEVVSAIPYLGAFYVSLARVHGENLSDVLLGGAIGALTTHLFYAWSFLRFELGLRAHPRRSRGRVAPGALSLRSP